MALKLLGEQLFNETAIAHCLGRYIRETGDYGLVDRFDQNPFQPTYNASSMTVDIFPNRNLRTLAFSLAEILDKFPLSVVLADFAMANITHGHVFPQPKLGGGLLPFYRQALLLLPPAHASQLLFWKRSAYAATEQMLPDRPRVWTDLWLSDFRYSCTFHPAIFLNMTNYKGPIPLFLQTVYAHLLGTIGGLAFHLCYDQIIAQPWHFSPGQKRFLDLWHVVMKETAIVYLPTASELATVVEHPFYMLNTDKLLCILLLLFNRAYRTRLDLILTSEPAPTFLASLFTRLPGL